MSFAAEGWAYDQQCGGGIAKSVLAYLAFRADRRTGECWPSFATIVKAVEHAEGPVRAALRHLVGRKLIERDPQFARNGRCTSTRYRLPVVAARGAQPECAAALDPAPTPADQQGTHPGQSAGVILEPSSKNEPREGSESVASATHARDPLPIDEILVEGQDGDGEGDGMAQTIEVAIGVSIEPSPIVEAGKQARRSGGKAPVPADWEPTQADRAFAIQRGLDPEAMRLAFVLWAHTEGKEFADPSARYQRWCLDEVGRYARKRDRCAERDAWVARSEALYADVPPDAVIVGYADGYTPPPGYRPTWGATP
jgi:hypothetical protein